MASCVTSMLALSGMMTSTCRRRFNAESVAPSIKPRSQSTKSPGRNTGACSSQGTTQGHIVHLDRRQGHLRQETGTVEQRPQRGELVAARIRPVVVFDDPAALIRPRLEGHL